MYAVAVPGVNLLFGQFSQILGNLAGIGGDGWGGGGDGGERPLRLLRSAAFTSHKTRDDKYRKRLRSIKLSNLFKTGPYFVRL